MGLKKKIFFFVPLWRKLLTANFGGAEKIFFWFFCFFYMFLHLVLIYSGLFQKKAILGAQTKMEFCIVSYLGLNSMTMQLEKKKGNRRWKWEIDDDGLTSESLHRSEVEWARKLQFQTDPLKLIGCYWHQLSQQKIGSQ